MIAALAFCLAAGLLTYVWVGYPLILRLLNVGQQLMLRLRPGRREPSPAAWGDATPRLSVIVAAYNEAGCIRTKLDGTLAQRYPAQRLEVIVVSDGSTDGTDAIVRGHPDPRIRLLRQEPRAGKSAALNRGVAAARGDVLVFTDANALFGPDALAALAAPFADPLVGVVSGQGLYGSVDVDARAVAGFYARYEAAIKVGESALGFLASTDGAIYAMRRSLYTELEPNEVNDLLHPIQAILAGMLSRFAPAAYTVEPPSSGGRQEFHRHVRIVAQGMHLLRRWLPSLVARRQPRAVWMLLSHRLLRWATAPALLTLLVANVALVVERGGAYTFTLAGQAAFYALVLAGGLADRAGRGLGTLALPYYFCVVAAAQMAGLVRFLRGGAQAVWSPTGGTVRERAA